MSIILASCSKRRSSILSSCGIPHKVRVSNVSETMKGASPPKIVMKNAYSKVEKVSKNLTSGYVIGADTVVLLNKKIIGKPKDLGHAKSMLKAMAGKNISVYTGLCVMDLREAKIALGYEKSVVKVKKLRPTEITRYFRLLGPYDKAGGFSIEGAGSFIFDSIKGSYFNVLGLPMAKLKECFEKLGIDLLQYVKC